MDQLREENEALSAQLKKANEAAERPEAERIREVVLVKEDAEGKAMAEAAKREVEEVSRQPCALFRFLQRYVSAVTHPACQKALRQNCVECG